MKGPQVFVGWSLEVVLPSFLEPRGKRLQFTESEKPRREAEKEATACTRAEAGG